MSESDARIGSECTLVPVNKSLQDTGYCPRLVAPNRRLRQSALGKSDESSAADGPALEETVTSLPSWHADFQCMRSVASPGRADANDRAEREAVDDPARELLALKRTGVY